MPKPTILALDLEGTLISNAVSQIARPKLFWFLDRCAELFGKIVIYTAVDEPRFRTIANLLVSEHLAPSWFADLEYIKWDKSIKNLLNVPCAGPQDVLLVDDQEAYIHPDQKDQWIKIAQFESPYDKEDGEFNKIIDVLVHRANID